MYHVHLGYAGGSYYLHYGGAAEYVCLPPDPQWSSFQDIRAYSPGYMWGAEYEDDVLYGMPDRKQEVPCAVCRSGGRTSKLMIPARTDCYTGWTMAYNGSLASGNVGHPGPSEYVCVDEHPEALVGGASIDGNGKLFFQVRTHCGSLQCPPYKNDKVMSCVVCLK